MRVLFLLLIVAILGVSGFAAHVFFGGIDQRDLELELAAYQSRIEALLPAAEKGDVEAQYAVAELYRYGRAHTQDLAAARKWYEKAAGQGHVDAQFKLGEIYEHGLGTRQDHARAAEWYALAARLGRHVEAEFALGNLYFHGRGVAHDYGQAIDRYRRAARRGHPVAQHIFARMLDQGWGIDRDPIEAYKWYTLALRDAGRIEAYDPELDTATARQRLAEEMNRDQIESAERAAESWKPVR